MYSGHFSFMSLISYDPASAVDLCRLIVSCGCGAELSSRFPWFAFEARAVGCRFASQGSGGNENLVCFSSSHTSEPNSVFPSFSRIFFHFFEDQTVWLLWVWLVFKAKYPLILLKGSSEASLLLFVSFPCAEQFLVPSALRGIPSSADLWVFHRDFPFTCSKCTRRWCCAGLKSTLRFVSLLSSVIKNLTTPPAATLCHFEGNVNVNN